MPLATSRRVGLIGALPVLALFAVSPTAAQSFPSFDVVWEQTFNGNLYSVAFAPDGAHVGAGGKTAGSGRVYIWRTADGLNTLTGTLGADVNAVTFSPDGAALIAAHAGASCQPNGGCGGFGNELSRWGAPSGSLLSRQAYPQAYVSLAVSPDGQVFAVGNYYAPLDYNAVRFHHPTTLDSVGFLPAITAAEVAYSPDGAQLVTGGFENLQYTADARVWDVATGALLRELPHRQESQPYMDEYPDAVAYSPDGRFIATGGWRDFGTTVIQWDAATGTVVRRFDARTEPGLDCGSFGLGTHVAFSANGRYLVGATSCEPEDNRTDLVVRFWDVETGELVRSYGMPGFYAVRGMRDFALSPAQNRMAFVYTSGTHTTTIVVAATDLDLAGGTTTAGEPGMEPGGFALSAARPNPTGGRASLTLTLTRAQRVSAVAYDPLGRRIADLFEGEVGAGSPLSLAFDGAGRTAGTYVIRVTGETFTAARRVIVAR
jgi:WD40 repeat protein